MVDGSSEDADRADQIVAARPGCFDTARAVGYLKAKPTADQVPGPDGSQPSRISLAGCRYLPGNGNDRYLSSYVLCRVTNRYMLAELNPGADMDTIKRLLAEDRKELVEALATQRIASGDKAVARDLAVDAQLTELPKGAIVYKAGDPNTDIYFVVSGEVDIQVRERSIATCGAGNHFGEMPVIDPDLKKKTVTVVTVAPTVLARVAAPNFTRIANAHPQVWRLLALELSNRLQRRD